jgi:hypothetical protein
VADDQFYFTSHAKLEHFRPAASLPVQIWKPAITSVRYHVLENA